MTDRDQLDRRIEELEEEVRRLRDELIQEPARDGAGSDTLSRRRLLGRAGVAAAAAAGALATPALTGRAAAADGGTFTLGQSNSATSETSLTRGAAGPSLALANSSTGVPLRLAAASPSTVDAGDVFMDGGGFFWGAFDLDAAGMFFDSSFAAFPVLFAPFRLLDTRQAGATSTNFGRSRVTNPTGKFDAAGRLKAGSSIDVRLNDFSEFAFGAIVNVTVTSPAGAGHLRSWPTTLSGPPNASIINYASGQTLANGLTLPLGFDAVDRDSITFDANTSATHVIVDISGLIVADPSSVVLAASATAASVQARRFARDRGPNRSR